MTRQENGIVYFDKPVTMNFLEFAFDHLGCDAIATRESSMDLEKTDIVAYASEEKYNNLLRKILYEKFGKEHYVTMGGISEVQAYGIF